MPFPEPTAPAGSAPRSSSATWTTSDPGWPPSSSRCPPPNSPAAGWRPAGRRWSWPSICATSSCAGSSGASRAVPSPTRGPISKTAAGTSDPRRPCPACWPTWTTRPGGPAPSSSPTTWTRRASPATAGTAPTRRRWNGFCSIWFRSTPGTWASWTSLSNSPPVRPENNFLPNGPRRVPPRPCEYPGALAGLLRDALVDALAQALDPSPQHVAGLQVDRRLAGVAHPAGRAGRD